ncbi:putative OSBP(Oxysterol binding protein)-related protein 4B [Melia azedarach]|uniref:OSBP(Oxysterol binding protein)-related protein 4B n=1 Tax=Melia azedarach TaxID=155640 RepID=A0ACC1XDD7_MELAZ|nr:putative OSBP(Oxysterol binding protein)-related protein 4B [Melia azedarach]
MDYSHHRKVSLLDGEECFFNKVLSRDSSVGYSSRILYYRSAEGVPFKWEMQPGTPKDPPKEDILPPLSPPPAILSLGLPKPCINIEEPKFSMRSKLKFWKHNYKKSQEIKRVLSNKEHDHVNKFSSGSFVKFELDSSDGEEFMASRRNSSSSSSSSFSFSQSSRIQSPAREKIDRSIYGCGPFNITSILVRVGRII